MRKSIARPLFSALTIILAGGMLAAAQGPGGMGPGSGVAAHRPPMVHAMGDHGGRWWNNPRMIERLKLTDDQRKAMDSIWYQHREKLIDLQANMERADLAMEPLMSADQPDRGAIESQIDKIVSARSALEKANALFLLDIRLKITPDQWKQLKDTRSEMMGRRGDRMDRGPGQRERMWRQRPDGQGPPPPPSPNSANPPAGQPQGSDQPPPQQ